MNVNEFRKIILVGYAFRDGAGITLLDGAGMPINPVKREVRLRIAFWVPQKAPFQRRGVGTFSEYLRFLVVRGLRESKLPVASLDAPLPVGNLAGYMRKHGLDVMGEGEQMHGYTLVPDATERELQALRDGAIVEQIQDFTFPRQPTIAELRRELMPHWEWRASKSLGHIPINVPKDNDPKPRMLLESVQKGA